jgi:hypothetical protein
MTHNGKKKNKSLDLCLLAGLLFFWLPLSCGGQNNTNHLKSKETVVKSETRDASQPKLSSPDGQQQNYAPDQVLVKFKIGATPETIERIQTELKLERLRSFASPNLFLMKITDGSSVEAMLTRLQTYEAVKYAEPNYVVKATQ